MTTRVLSTRSDPELDELPAQKGAVLAAFAAACSLAIGSAVGANASVLVPLAAAPLWLLLPWLGRRAPVALAVVVPSFAYAMTMLSVRVFQLPCEPGSTGIGPFAFGEHPVFWRAGLPWPGVEGSDHGCAMDRVPFTSGVDALLVDFGCWALLGWWWLRSRRAATLQGLRWPLCVAATLCGLSGAWQLVVMFD